MLQSLRFRTWLLLMAGTGAVLFVMAGFYYESAKGTIRESLSENARVKVAAHAEALSVWLNTRINQVRMLAQDPTFKAGDTEARMLSLKKSLATDGIYYSLGIADETGTLRLTDGRIKIIRHETPFVLCSQGQIALSPPISSINNPSKQLITIHQPIVNAEGRVDGVLAAAVTADDILASQTNFGDKRTGLVFLTDDKGNFLYGQKPVSPFSDEAKEELLLKLAVDQGEGAIVRDSSLLYIGAGVKGANWELVAVTSPAALYQPLHSLLQRTIGVALLAELFLGLLLYLIINPLVNRIKEILKKTEAVASGQFRVKPLKIHSRDEIGALAASVNGMVEHLRHLFEPLQAVTNQNDYGIIVTNDQYVVVHMNETAINKLGYEAGEIVGKQTPLAFSLPEDMQRKAAKLSAKLGYTVSPGLPYLRARITNRLSYTEERMYVHKDGSRIPVHLNESKIVNENGRTTGYVGLFRDITKQKQAQAELLQAKQTAEAASASKGLFLARMSHEIRTPINGIVGLSQLLERTSLNDFQRDYVQKILSSSDVLLGIVNDILDFSKIEAGQMKVERVPFDPEDLFRKLADTLSIFLGKKQLDMIFDVTPFIPPLVIGDPLRLKQVLLNLTNNAIKFTEEGYVTFRVRFASSAPGEATLVYSVEDTGIGIDAEQLDGLFRPFFQADGSISRKYGGSGLGLVIADELVTLMGGRLEVSSKVGSGSCFSFTLTYPLADQSSQSEPYPQLHRTILCIEQPGLMQEALAGMLSPLRAELTFVPSWKDALLLLAQEESNPPFDYVLSNMEMPDMYGEETWLQLRRSARSAKIIVMTTPYGQNEWQHMPQENCPDSSVVKPLNRRALIHALLVLEDKVSYEAAAPEWLAGRAVSAVVTSQAKQMEQEGVALRILLVDDHSINQLVARELLEERGYEVGVAQNGLEALDKLEAERWHLVLMDLHMPIMDGFEATEQIRRTWPAWQLPILAMTANVMEADRRKCYQTGMNEVMTKPIKAGVLYEAVEQWIALSKVIDWEDALQRVDGKEIILRRMIRTFVTDFPSFPHKLRKALEAGQQEQALDWLHGFRGVVSNLSAKSLLDLAIRLEKAISGQKHQDAEQDWKDLLNNLTSELDRAIAALRREISRENELLKAQ